MSSFSMGLFLKRKTNHLTPKWQQLSCFKSIYDLLRPVAQYTVTISLPQNQPAPEDSILASGVLWEGHLLYRDLTGPASCTYKWQPAMTSYV